MVSIAGAVPIGDLGDLLLGALWSLLQHDLLGPHLLDAMPPAVSVALE